jgi:hypothetical protein
VEAFARSGIRLFDVLTTRINRRAGVLTGVIWLAVLFIAELFGGGFDATSVHWLWQLVPFEDLQANPFGSVWNLHIQPPLWNLIIGILARWSPLPFGLGMQLLMAGFGFVATVLLFDTLRHIGVRTRWAAPLTLFAMCSPDVLVNGFEPRYELAVTAGLIAIAWVIVRANESLTRGNWLIWLSVLATAVTMTRTLYHPVWLAFLVAFFAWRWREHVSARWIGAAAAIPLVLVGGWMLKNKVLFGRFTLDTWSGMNLQRAVVPLLHADDKRAMLASGELSGVSAVGPFANYELYSPSVGPCTNHWDSPVLSKLARPPFGIANFNAGCYLRVYDLAGKDARTAILDHPDAYMEGRLWSARRWFALDETFTHSDSTTLRGLGEGYRVALIALPGMLIDSNWGMPIGPDQLNHFSLLALVCSIAVVVAACNRRGRDRDLFIFVGSLTVWTFASGVLFELGEQPRFRSMIDPLVLAFGAVAVARGVNYVRGVCANRSLRPLGAHSSYHGSEALHAPPEVRRSRSSERQP